MVDDDKRPTGLANETKGRPRQKVDRANIKEMSMVHNRLGLSKSGFRFALAALV